MPCNPFSLQRLSCSRLPDAPVQIRDLGRKAELGQSPDSNKGTGSDMKLDEIKILDCFIYNGEMIVELRLQYLYDVADEIIVVESRTTFSGVQKPELFIERDRQLFEPYMSKVTFLIIDDYPEPDQEWVQRQQKSSWMTDLTVWFREAYQRNFPGLYIQVLVQSALHCLLAEWRNPSGQDFHKVLPIMQAINTGNCLTVGHLLA